MRKDCNQHEEENGFDESGDRNNTGHEIIEMR
jgi:hypothetical protein